MPQTTRRTWTRLEVEAIVADYFVMLEAELRGEAFNKAEHNRRLRTLLDNRSKQAIELKHQNISAILIGLRFPFVNGYKPLYNYQRQLKEIVAAHLSARNGLVELAGRMVDAPASDVPTVDDILAVLESPPTGSRIPSPATGRAAEAPVRYSGVDYLKREAENRSLGAAGEEFVLKYERARLIHAGREALADRIEQVSRTRGDAEGYDVLSFEPTGRERLIEVKTTGLGKETPFFVSRNQVRVSQCAGSRFHLYRVFRFRTEPRLFVLPGPLATSCTLDPVEFVARVS